MAIASHRNYVSCTAEDLERGAGRLETVAKTSPDQTWATAAHGAAQALYAMAWHEIKSEDDMLTIWSMLMTSREAGDAAQEN